ncbi:hypothetical protein PG999_012276 [Apiospora kogelbergensis]|uniref:Glycosyl transferase family 2 n=1 Tax=Apiospora kogelbergensis TaxID=1337665 RepID=A0AAW0QH62_9PEZI
MILRSRHLGAFAKSTQLTSGIEHALTKPGIRAALVLFVFVSLYTLYGFRFFYRDPLSIFFSTEHGYDRFYSQTREAEALTFLDHAAAARSDTPQLGGKAGDDPSICATFITVGRNMSVAGRREYVDAAVGSALAKLSRAERAALHLKVFFADVPDAAAAHDSFRTFRDRLAARDAGVLDDVYTYDDTLPELVKDQRLDVLEMLATPSRGKSLYDYGYALDRCVETTNASYIAVFEDDIVLADGWVARTLAHLRGVEEMMRDPRRKDPTKGVPAPGQANDWIYLRLFNQDRSVGWAGGTGFRDNNAHVISAAVAVPLLALLVAGRRWCLPRRRGAPPRRLDAAGGVRAGDAAASLVPQLAGVREEWFGCCNQALVYNRAHAPKLSTFFMRRSRDKQGGRGDMLSKDFAWDHGLSRLSAYPMLAQHVGVVSATNTTAEEAQQIWNLAFENFRPAKLAKQHVRDVREIFGEEAARELLEQQRHGT